MKKLLLLSILLISTTDVSAQSLTSAGIFTDNMVLQRQQQIPVWGTAKPNDTVTVSFNKKTININVDNKGFWRTEFPEMSAGGPYSLHIQSNNEKIVYNNIKIGDIWVASGQSNMEWKVGWKINNWEQEVKNSNFPNIRFFKIDTNVSVEPSTVIKGSGWKVASPTTVGNFSAAAWFFAKHYQEENNVPIGIIESNVGGTPAEAWTPASSLLQLQGYKDDANDMQNNKHDRYERIKTRQKNDILKWELIESESAINNLGVNQNAFFDKNWATVTVPLQEPLKDVVWLRKNIELDVIPTNASLSFGELNQIAKVYVNGQLVENKSWEDKAKTISLPNNVLKKGNNVIALRVINSWDNKVQVGKNGLVWLKHDNKTINLSGKWRYSNKIEPQIPHVERISSWVSGLYNGMIHPITRVPIKGVIWYQGESNTDRADEYLGLFSGLIQGWRKQWAQDDFPFIYAQLSSWMPQKSKPSDSDWAELREAQTNTLSLPNTAMAVTIDIGDANDIHPRNKQEVGRRLWLATKSLSLTPTNDYNSPKVNTVNIDHPSSLIVAFQTSKPLQPKGSQILGFELAGNDGVYFNAKATIMAKDVVKVFSKNVISPKSVRYAWADNSPANLYNENKLPVTPFRYGEKVTKKLSD